MGNDELQPRTFYVNVTELEQFKKISPISASEAVRNLFRQAIEDTFDDAQLIVRSEYLAQANTRLNERLNELNTERNSVLQEIESNNKQIQDLRDRAELIHRTKRLGDLTMALNKQLVAYHFDEEYINDMCADIIFEIRQIKPAFDLAKHITRMKVIMGF